MDGKASSSSERDLKLDLKSNECDSKHFRNHSHSVRILEDLQSQRKNEVLCDIRFEADDGKIVFGHKNVLMAGSPYFCPYSQMIRCKPRQIGGSQKVILLFKRSKTLPKCYTEWYDPATKQRKIAPGMNDCRQAAGFGVIRDQFVFAVGGMTKSSCQSVTMLDISLRSPCWIPVVNMLISRKLPGVGVLDNCIYAVGGYDGASSLNSVEVFDVSIQKWQMVSSISITRRGLGVGVLNNRLYAVGGANGGRRLEVLKSVECYDPSLDKWTPVSEMSERRVGVSVGVLDGVMYAIGGYNGSDIVKSAEIYRPSDGVWFSISDMNLCRCRPGVVTLNGLLYVIGGETEISIADTLEIYNPKTNTWSMETLSRSGGKMYGGVVVDRPPNFVTY